MCSVTWAVTAVTLANTMPNPAIAAPKAIEPPSGRSWLHITSVMSAPTTASAATATIRAAVTGALRPSTGPYQLGPARLLVGPGVPADQEHAHEPHDDVAEAADLEHDLAAHGVDAVGGAVEGDDGGVVVHRPRRRAEVGLGGVEALTLAAVAHTSSTIPRTHTASRMRSRRSRKRTSTPVPAKVTRPPPRARRPSRGGRGGRLAAALELGQLVAVVAEEQLLQRGRAGSRGCSRPARRGSAPRRRAERCRRRTTPGCRRSSGRGPRAGRRARRGFPAASTVTDVRVR